MFLLFRRLVVFKLFVGLLLLPQVVVAADYIEVTTKVPISYSKYLSEKNIPFAKKAIKVFASNCLSLMTAHATDIELISVQGIHEKSDYGCVDYRCEDYGWIKTLHVEIKIKDEPTTFSGPMVRIAGHTLHFWIGGPSNPGYTTTKFPQVCGVDEVRGHDVYVSVPEMKSLWE